MRPLSNNFNFIQLHRNFLSKDLSLLDTMLLSIIADRIKLSASNKHFSDAEGIYSFFNLSELSSMLNVSTRSISRHLEKLSKEGFISYSSLSSMKIYLLVTPSSSFMKIPSYLFNKSFNLSVGAIITYAYILSDITYNNNRGSNFDKNNIGFSRISRNNLASGLNVSANTVSTYVKHLKSCNLLFEEVMGFKKSNRIYLLECDTDINNFNEPVSTSFTAFINSLNDSLLANDLKDVPSSYSDAPAIIGNPTVVCNSDSLSGEEKVAGPEEEYVENSTTYYAEANALKDTNPLCDSVIGNLNLEDEDNIGLSSDKIDDTNDKTCDILILNNLELIINNYYSSSKNTYKRNFDEEKKLSLAHQSGVCTLINILKSKKSEYNLTDLEIKYIIKLINLVLESLSTRVEELHSYQLLYIVKTIANLNIKKTIFSYSKYLDKVIINALRDSDIVNIDLLSEKESYGYIYRILDNSYYTVNVA